jgi:hypothetical protein
MSSTPALQRARAARAGVRIEQITIGWMTIEALVAIGSGLRAHSILLTAFGLDSVIELVTGGVLLWRLSTEAHGASMARVERAENRAAWVTGFGLILLCLYLIVSAGAGLLLQDRPEASPVGIGLALAAVVGMPLLAWRKRGDPTRRFGAQRRVGLVVGRQYGRTRIPLLAPRRGARSAGASTGWARGLRLRRSLL